MSKPLTIWMKIKIFLLWLNQHESGTLVSCAYCDSTNVRFTNQSERDISNNSPMSLFATKIYNSRYTCLNCGATCINRQEWQKKIN